MSLRLSIPVPTALADSLCVQGSCHRQVLLWLSCDSGSKQNGFPAAIPIAFLGEMVLPLGVQETHRLLSTVQTYRDRNGG